MNLIVTLWLIFRIIYIVLYFELFFIIQNKTIHWLQIEREKKGLISKIIDNKNELRTKLHNSSNKYIHRWFIFSGIIANNKRNILLNEKKKRKEKLLQTM